MKRGIKLFLSHNSADKPFVRKVADDLERLGLNVWLDERKLKAGDSITDGIAEGMSSYDAFLIFLSQKSVNAPWVKEELRIAINRRVKTQGNIKIIPILMEDCRIPLFLEDYIYVDFRDSANYIDSIDFLFDSIIFDDKLLLQYRNDHPGYGLVERIYIDAKISGHHYDFVTFKETHRIKPFKNTDKYEKKLTIDGELLDIGFSRGSIAKTQKSKSDWQLDMVLDKQFRVGKVVEFDVFYSLKNEFRFENSWFFRIESPTKKLEATFNFGKECPIKKFLVKHLRALGEMDRDYLPKIENSSGAGYEFNYTLNYPAYRDRYEFSWE